MCPCVFICVHVLSWMLSDERQVLYNGVGGVPIPDCLVIVLLELHLEESRCPSYHGNKGFPALPSISLHASSHLCRLR